ncbi:transposase (plasmid) [Acidithiobacillus caldus]|nr:transposase [Acidithiobacillus caldus]
MSLDGFLHAVWSDFWGLSRCSDDYGGYDALYRKGRITEAGCWAHVRRHFYDGAMLESGVREVYN